MQRKVWCDWVRALACMMVVVLHATGPFQTSSGPAPWLELANILQAATRPAVPFFFAISGALLLSRPTSDPMSIYRRIVKGTVPLLFYTAIYYAFSRLYLDREIAPLGFLNQPVFYHLWFFYAYLPVAIVLTVIRPAPIPPTLGAAVCFIALLAFGGGLVPFGAGAAFYQLTSGLLYLLYAVAGYYAAQINLGRRGRILAAAIYIIATAALVYVTALESVAAGSLVQTFYEYSSVFVIVQFMSGFLFLVSALSDVRQTPKIVAVVAGSSLGIYGLHPLIIHVMLDEFDGWSGGSMWLMAATILFAVGGSWLLASTLGLADRRRLVT